MLIPSRLNKDSNIIIAGNSGAIVELSRYLTKILQHYNIIGVIYFPADNEPPVFPKLSFPANNLGSITELPQYLTNHIVDEIFIITPVELISGEIRKVIDICLEMGIVCHVPAGFPDLNTYKSIPQNWGTIKLQTLYTGTLYNNKSLLLKYQFDFCFALVLLILLAPVFLVITLAVKLSSNGPVFFVHKRVGYNRRIFNMIKFRTMVKNAEAMQAELERLNEADGAAFKIAHDPRITPIGKWLRKMSLDELPQLVNVLRGDMSLVGPRPLPVRDVGKIEHRWQYRRFSAQPGMTCTWQTSRRYDMPFDEWAKLDLAYIDNWSLGNDLKILFKTIPAVLLGKGQ